MAVRIRKDGRIFCAAMTEQQEGDLYIDDRLHYHLSVITKVLVTTPSETHNKTNGEWYFINAIPEYVIIDEFYLTNRKK